MTSNWHPGLHQGFLSNDQALLGMGPMASPSFSSGTPGPCEAGVVGDQRRIWFWFLGFVTLWALDGTNILMLRPTFVVVIATWNAKDCFTKAGYSMDVA